MNRAGRKSGGNRWAKVSFMDRLLERTELAPYDGDGRRPGWGDTPCWDWKGTATKKGYGQIYRGGRRVQAPRAAYEELRGPMPEGTEIDHLCKRPTCVNPWHLEPVDRRTNLLRGTGFAARNAQKTHCPRGHAYTPENTYALEAHASQVPPWTRSTSTVAILEGQLTIVRRGGESNPGDGLCRPAPNLSATAPDNPPESGWA